jgi:hypothetical protein
VTISRGLTVDHRYSGFGFQVIREQCRKVRESAKPDLPKYEGRIAEKTVGKELPRELEELLTLRAIEKEKVLVERGCCRERLRQSGIRAKFSLFSVAERKRRHHATEERKAIA